MMLQQSSGHLAESFHYEIRNTFIHTTEEDNSALARSKSSPAILLDSTTQFRAPNLKESTSIPDRHGDGVLGRLIQGMQMPLENENVPLPSLLSLVATARGEPPREFAVPPSRLDEKFFWSAASTTASEADHSEVLFQPAMPRRQRGLHGQWLWDKTLRKVVDKSSPVVSPSDDGRMRRSDFKSKSAHGMCAFPNFDPGDGNHAESLPHGCDASSWNSAAYPTQPLVYMMPVGGAPNYASCLPLQVPPVALLRPSSNQQHAHRGPALGSLHHFHLESRGTGELSEDCRTFTKKEYQGRLSVITEAEMHSSGITRHVIQFTEGELSAADGVGFVFSRTLPCPKNIKRITSIFVNRSGRICLRGGSDVVRSNTSVSKLRVGDWIEMTVDLQKMVAFFVVWPASGMCPSSAVFSFGSALNDLNIQVSRQGQPVCGYLACVVQNLGVTIAFRS
jgi:hypothetical protein